MAHHAYVLAGDRAQGMTRARSFVLATYGEAAELDARTHGLFTVEDARMLIERAYRRTLGGQLVLIVDVTRIFHEAQNALLKLFEEPPHGVTLILLVPSEGLLLPTLRSRLMTLPVETEEEVSQVNVLLGIAEQFLALTPPLREKFIEKLVTKSKSDTDEDKQQARSEAVELVEGLTRYQYQTYLTEENAAAKRVLVATLSELAAFTPILHERSAPLKLIFEHLLHTIPSDGSAAKQPS